MTVSDARPTTLAGGFAFARQQRDPEFRSYLRDIGWTPDHDVVITADDELASSLVSRMINNGTSTPCLIAFPHEGARFGFRLMFAEVVEHRWPWTHRGRRHQLVKIAPGASIGMLYDSLTRCGEYLPSEWVRPVMFERVATATTS